MKGYNKLIFIQVSVIVFFTSCSTLEKASIHGFKSGYYKLQSEQENAQNVYVDVTDEKIDVYHETGNQPDKKVFLSISLKPSDSILIAPMEFRKSSLDIDITAILLKYRPSVDGLEDQLTTDFNVALYTGWRHDNYNIISENRSFGKELYKVFDWGYDFGFLAGPGYPY